MRRISFAACGLVLISGMACSGSVEGDGSDAGVTTDGRAGQDPDGGSDVRQVCRIETDVDVDTTIDRIETRFYTDNLLRWIRRDSDVDGVDNYVQERIYNSYRGLVTLQEDLGNDGIMDRVQTFGIGPDGKRTSREFDTDNNGEADEIWLYVYDDNDFLSEVRKDLDADGAVDRIDRYLRAVDGLIYRTERDDAVDGVFDEVPDWIETRVHADGVLVLLEQDRNVDTIIDYRLEYVRDPVDLVVTQLKVDTNADGTLEELRDYIYECS